MKRGVSQATSPSCQRYSASLSSDHRSMLRHTAKNPRWFSLSLLLGALIRPAGARHPALPGLFQANELVGVETLNFASHPLREWERACV